MNNATHTLELAGCAPTPLAHYLKALGILRLVSEQIPDSQARGWWEEETFWLRSTLDEEQLVHFFLHDYQPTPMVAPWNGGSGFYQSDNTEAIDAILASDSPQFGLLKDAIRDCQSILSQMSLKSKPKDDVKPRLLQRCRNLLPDQLLDWLDAAYLLTAEGPKYPPLLGTGGNDGRLEFTNNYMQHLVKIVPPSHCPNSESQVREALFGQVSCVRASGTIGQFDPGNLGGANSGTGYEGTSTVNSWDYVLMMEGAITFAAASVKKLESSEWGTLAYPFCVRPAGIGYESSSVSDENDSRCEMWLPLWHSASSYQVVSALLSEGRVETNRRRARNGVDFARAISSLGVDRGVDEFSRFGFQQRNGLAYLAVPLGRFQVRAAPQVEELLAPVDQWLMRFRNLATGKNAPARAGRALRGMEAAILKLCQRGSKQDVQDLLIAFGKAEAAIAISPALRDREKGKGISPVPPLDKRWLELAGDNSPEFHLAASLASLWHDKVGPMRKHLEPINWKRMREWLPTADSASLVWTGGDLVRNLNAVLNRRMIEIRQLGKQAEEDILSAPIQGKYNAHLKEISAFINSEVDERRLDELLHGLILINWSQSIGRESPSNQPNDFFAPDAVYALLKLCHLPWETQKERAGKIKLNPQIAHRALAGEAVGATQLAARRLLADGVPSAVDRIHVSADRIRRIAAALLFPISRSAVGKLESTILARHLREDSSQTSEQSNEPVETQTH